MPSVASSSPEAAAPVESFSDHCVAVNVARLRMVIGIILAIVLIASPIQYLLLAPEPSIWQRRWMLGVLALFVGGAAAVFRSAALRRHADLVCAGLVSGAVGIQAAGLSRIGGLETLYAGVACVTPAMALFFLIPLRRRD